MSEHETVPILPEDVPVVMPQLPATKTVTTPQHLKALGDPLRWRIINVIHHQPATAKRIAELIGSTPGTVGHHLHVLEDAELVQIIARRLIRGTVANYYTRTARIFRFDVPDELVGDNSLFLNKSKRVHDELADAYNDLPDDPYRCDALLHLRVSKEKAEMYRDKINALVEEMIQEPSDPHGQVYTIFTSMFTAPKYGQVGEAEEMPADKDTQESIEE